jgi:hypothetical protein
MNAAAVAILWLGVVIGVAFLATPVKFSAPSLDLPTALEVGRVTFRLLARVEWVLAALLVSVVVLSQKSLPWSALVAFGVLVLETAWLLPALGARTDAIRAGVAVPPSHLHTVFIGLELAKCGALAHTAFALARAAAIALPQGSLR